MITSDSELKYPYLNDGLIYHPNEQKYIIEAEKSKYSEYKLKPPTKNSIDLYIQFEKDKISGKILTVYDNSVKDVLKNKPYQIANLYAGSFVRGVEKPVLFGEEEGVSQAYLYLDEQGIPKSIDGKQILDKTVVKGINLSHKMIVRDAKEKGQECVCILEDDCIFPAADGWEYFISSIPEKFELHLGATYILPIRLALILLKVPWFTNLASAPW
jgi:hypothetical protein